MPRRDRHPMTQPGQTHMLRRPSLARIRLLILFGAVRAQVVGPRRTRVPMEAASG